MNRETKELTLQAGQIWRVPAAGRIEIRELGKTLVHYRHFKGRQRRGIRMDIRRTVTIADYLKEKGARLMKGKIATVNRFRRTK